MKKSINERGFTIVELLAAIVILSIILLSVMQIFIFSTKTVTSTQSKLVTTHLAKATIERIKVDAANYIPFTEVEEDELVIDKDNCTALGVECSLYTTKLNDTDYDVEIIVSQTPEEKNLNLVNVVVNVKQTGERFSSTVEGYVVYEE